MNQVKFIFAFFLLFFSSAILRAEKNQFPEEKKKEKQLLSYNGGNYAPFGLMTGFTFAKGHGFYLNARCNQHVLKKSAVPSLRYIQHFS